MPLLETLKDFGLSEKEGKIYLANLELGATTVQELAKKSEIKRTTVYTVIEDLKKKGLISEMKKGAKTLFVPEEPEKLARLISEREKKFKEILPELKSIYNLAPQKPRVRFYEGKEGIKNILEDVLKTGKNYYHVDPSEQDLIKLVGENYLDELVKRRVENKIFCQVIWNKEPWAEKQTEKNKEVLRESKWLPKEYRLPTREYIYGDKVALMFLEKEPTGLIIEDKNIADLQRLFFETLWKSCKE
ncbi:MAG: helix-turn-helix domain-containing protein [Patescibacteria group bacterium]|jgi:sugar-specific transcriptional regulator TrmB